MDKVHAFAVAVGVLGLACSAQAQVVYVNSSSGGTLGSQIRLDRLGVL